MAHKKIKWFDEYKKLGYTLEQAKSGHYKVRSPEGHFVITMSHTPSDWRAEKNKQADLRRFEARRLA